MRALTVKNPWAHLLMSGNKDVENRSRRTNYRGRIAVHVAKKAAKPEMHMIAMLARGMDNRLDYLNASGVWLDNPDAGMVIGTIDLVDCIHGYPSPWSFSDHWQWVMANPVWLDEPVEAKGMLGLWEWTP